MHSVLRVKLIRDSPPARHIRTGGKRSVAAPTTKSSPTTRPAPLFSQEVLAIETPPSESGTCPFHSAKSDQPPKHHPTSTARFQSFFATTGSQPRASPNRHGSSTQASHRPRAGGANPHSMPRCRMPGCLTPCCLRQSKLAPTSHCLFPSSNSRPPTVSTPDSRLPICPATYSATTLAATP